MEPSDSLVDTYVAQYEQDRIQCVPWDRLTSKEQELGSTSKRKSTFSINSSGKLRTESKSDAKAETGAELLLQLALQRRGVAVEMSNFLDYNLHSKWIERLIVARLDPVSATHVLPTF